MTARASEVEGDPPMKTQAIRTMLALSMGALPLVAGASARAQSAADKAAAEALFNEAEKLVGAKDYVQACPKYAESLRLDPGVGVMLYLANCYEHVGKTASAWAEYKEAEDLATKRTDPKRAALAHEHAEKLASKLSRLTIAVSPAARAAGVEIKRDGETVGSGQWGTPVPVDPGAHAITASAAGKSTWTSSITVGDTGEAAKVTVPDLADAPAAPSPASTPTATGASAPLVAITSPPPPTAEVGTNTGSQRTIGIAVAAAGIVGIGVGAVFGLTAKSKLDDSNANGLCHPDNHCNQAGYDLRSDAKSAALISTIAFGAGIVTLAGGVIVFATAPKAQTTAMRVTPYVSPAAGGVVVTKSF
jgi:hypothetical protein